MYDHISLRGLVYQSLSLPLCANWTSPYLHEMDLEKRSVDQCTALRGCKERCVAVVAYNYLVVSLLACFILFHLVSIVWLFHLL